MLGEISEIWPLIDWGESNSRLCWREPHHSKRQGLVRHYQYSVLGYFVIAAVSMIGSWIVLAGHVERGWVEWIYLVGGWGITFYFLARQEHLNIAKAAVPRWLAGMCWKDGDGRQVDEADLIDVEPLKCRGLR